MFIFQCAVPPGLLHVMLKIVQGIVQEDTMLFKKPVHFHACFETEQPSHSHFGEPVPPIAFERYGFEHCPRGLVSPN